MRVRPKRASGKWGFKELLRNYPGKLLSEVAAESGFSSMKSFLRTFKAQTGFTPTQWKEQ